jgi:outer membrane protein TolC
MINAMKTNLKTGSVCLALFCTALINAQSLTLESCYDLAKQNYPLVKQRELITKTGEYTVDNISKGYLPQVSVNGQYTYQSDVTKIPINIPGVAVPTIDKDQYKIYGEVVQPITDLITVKQQKDLQRSAVQTQEQNLEVELYKLKDRINQLYFGVLLVDEQLVQNELLKKDIQSGIDKISAALANGTDYKSSLNKFKAELLKAKQRDIELKNSRKAYLDMLGLFINQSTSENTILEKPKLLANSDGINRPELISFESQKRSYDLQKKLVNSKAYPKLSLFFQGGWGKPSPVNMLSNEFKEYYIGGARLNWSFTSLYTNSKEKKILELNKSLVDVQKETFLFNTSFSLKQQSTELSKLAELLISDKEIIELRTSVKTASGVQLANGIITSNDYIKEVSAEDQARQAMLLHEIQLLMAQYNQRTITGN